MLLERPGEVMTREAIRRRLWPEDTFVDFEHSLNSTVRRLRDALGDNAENPQFIETLPRLGYRFIVSVEMIENTPPAHTIGGNGNRLLASHSADAHQAAPIPPDQPARNSEPVAHSRAHSLGRTLWLSVGAISAAAVAVAAWWLFSPRPQLPRVTNITKITNDGLPEGAFVTDGSRIYYCAGPKDHLNFYQRDVKGGEPVRMKELDGLYPLDISSDRLELLLAHTKDHSLWMASVVGNAPRPLTGLFAYEAKWSPSGTHIVYAPYPRQKELRIIRSDGSDSRTLANVDGLTYGPSWYPDGSKIVFSSWTESRASLWEVSADGTGLHRLFPEWTDYSQWYASWTPDGKYLVFMALQQAHSYQWDIWTAKEGGALSGSSGNSPARLTTGPLRVNQPVLSPDGKRIFFHGVLDRLELVRSDPITKQWVPYLSGLSAEQLDFSSDGKSLAYVSFPEEYLFRSDRDGGHKLQLMPEMQVMPPSYQGINPRFSPDGKLIAFAGPRVGEPSRVYVETAEGNSLRKLTNGECGPDGEWDPAWSPNGAFLVLGCSPRNPKAGLTPESTVLRMVDVKTGKVSVLAGSHGLWFPRWSPKGRYLVALSFPDPPDLVLYDMQTQTQRKLFVLKFKNAGFSNMGWPAWSRDGQYVYIMDGIAEYRVRITDGAADLVADLTGLSDAYSSNDYSSWAGITPDGSVIATRNTGTVEIYALDWIAP